MSHRQVAVAAGAGNVGRGIATHAAGDAAIGVVAHPHQGLAAGARVEQDEVLRDLGEVAVPAARRDEDLFARSEAAWGAIAECLYADGEPPAATDLARARLRGLNRLRDSALRERGYASRSGGSGRDLAAGAMTAGTF